MSTVIELVNAIAPHQGAANGIPAAVLASQLGVMPRQLRRLVCQARDQGVAICGTPGTGYFIPATPEELEASCAFLRRRALHSLRLLSRMRNVALPTLLGQLLLSQG